ncbi:MAG: hypothetical protein IJO65_11755 [Lachnospiraceae bacterium]|nr:hypothetical protein [Lachnospiraceae bacterium]
MSVVHIVAFIILVFGISYCVKETLIDVIPVTVCLITLILYGLSFINGLLFWDYVAVLICAVFILVLIMVIYKKRARNIWIFFKEEIKRPGTFIAMALLVLVPVLVSGKVVTWWDDYNFWATDAKSIYFLNGFAQKYQNVAPEFGDYPPGTQMMKWFFLHLSPNEFKEGLMFSGYHFMNLCFLIPLLKALKEKNIFLMPIFAVALWLFPTCVEVFGIDGFCADLTMALIYGYFLVAVVDREEHSDFFYYGRQALLLMVLVLCKNIAFIWVAFALFFSYGYYWFCDKSDRNKKAILVVTLLPVVTEISWLSFCLLNRRVAKLTGAAVQMAVGKMNVPEVKDELIEAFTTAFISYPLHRWKTVAIDLSPIMLFILLLLFVRLLYKGDLINKKQGWYIGSFFGISGLFFYSIILLAHLTIFAVETQYLEPFGMVSSMERYGAPFTIGNLYLVAYLMMKSKKIVLGCNKGILLCLLFVFLTADYESAYRGLIGYRTTVSQALQERDEIVDESAEAFLEKVRDGKQWSGKRVLYLRDSSDYSWVRNTYIGFEAAPVSVMYGNLDGTVATDADVIRAIEDTHAGYLYADEIMNGQNVFLPLVGNETFEYGCLYRIDLQEEKLQLTKVNG